MFISLHASAKKDIIGSYKSTVIPRVGENIHLIDAAPTGVLLQVVRVCYQAQNDQESSTVEVQVTAANDAARQYIGKMLYNIV